MDKLINGVQTLLALLGVPLTIVPLGKWLWNGDSGAAFRWVFGEQTWPMAVVLPLLLIVVIIAALGGLEHLKKYCAS